MRTRVLIACWIVVAAAAVAAACGGKKPPPPKEPEHTETVSDAGSEDAADAEPPKPRSLLERLGGKDAIAKVVDSFIKNVASNDVTKKRFAKLSKDKLERFRKNLIDKICEAAQAPGGDCKYTGKDMKTAHKGLKITEAEWNATVSALKAALDENHVGDTEQSDLIALLAPMKDDIVESKKPKGK